MVNLKYYIDNDWFKIGRYGESHVKRVNIGLLCNIYYLHLFCLVIGSILLFSLVFYIIIYSSTNFNSLDQLEDYVETYGAEENLEFDSINLGMKIMPSYNTEKNVLYMEHSNNIYKSKIPQSLSIMEALNMNNTFFFINKTDNIFPKLSFTQANVPVGDSISMCLAVSWANKERGNNYDIMKKVGNFPKCKSTESGKFIWNNDDPTYGINVPVWRQKSVDIDCTGEEDCNRYCTSINSIYVNGVKSKKCYSYEILDTVCIVVEYNPDREEYNYVGGCFKDRTDYLMTPAEANKVYRFEGIEIEVRNRKDPVINAGIISNYTYNFGEDWNYFAIVLNVLILLSLIGLAVIAYLIYYYRAKYNTGSLLSQNHATNDHKYNSNKSADTQKPKNVV